MEEDLIALEVKEVFETMRHFYGLLVQALSILAVANITVIGYAITTQTAGILFVGAFIVLFTLGVMIGFDALVLAPVWYRAITLKQRLGGDVLGFFPLFLAAYYRDSLPNELAELSKMSDSKTMIHKLHRLFAPSPRRFSKRISILLTVAAVQLLVIPVLVNLFNWKMF